MQTIDTANRATPPAYESPTGSLVRLLALIAGIGLSLLVGTGLLVEPDLVAARPVWLVWALTMLVSALVYGVGTLVFRCSSYGQSRRMQRWLRSRSG